MMADLPDSSGSAEPQAVPTTEQTPARRPSVDRRRGTGDGLAALVGSGGSQVGTNGAMRARDVSRPR